ncbi:MAG: hypothetical protein R3362_05955, partial [Rhodothermales bacterium]|nr:hypothetical protein [Rhodothermales bacterium]
AGAVYVFERDGEGTWRETARIGGVRAAVVRADLDGDRLLVGHPQADGGGAAVLYGRADDGRWHRLTTFRPAVPYADGAFGTTVRLRDRRALVVGYTEQVGLDFNIDRVVYVFGYGEGGWEQQQVVDLGAWAFGAAMDHDGRRALIGQASEAEPGAAYLVDLR